MQRPADRPDPARLLEAFVASDRCDKAFAALVGSLDGLVYSSALRRTGNAQLAEEVAQNVFAIMARKAGALRRHPSLTAWALKTTRLQSANAMRSEKRRQRKLAALTSEAAARQSQSSNAMDDSSTWKDVVPFLDEALDRLSPQDQKLILLRFYEEKKFKDIANQNGQTESACKKRVQRALQKLSSILTSRGVSLSGTAVASLLGAEFARAVPAHTAAVLAPNAIAASSSLSTTTLVANTLQTMSTLKSTSMATAAVVALAVFPISQQLANGKRLQSELRDLEEQRATSAREPAGNKGDSRGQSGEAPADRWAPRTASSMLDDLGAPVDYRALAKQVMSVSSPRHANEDPWACSMVYARLNSLSEEEYDEFLNVLADYPAPEGLKKLTGLMIRMFHPGLAESWQDTLERVMERGRGGNSLDSMGFWAEEDPDAALAWYREKVASGEILGKGLETKFEKKTFESLVTMLAASRPKEALEMFRDRPQELRSPGLAGQITRKLTTGLIETGDDTYLRQMFELHDRSRVLQGALKEFVWSRKLGDGVAFVEQFVTDPGERTDYIVRAVCGQEGIGRQGTALDWMRDNTPEAEAPELFRRLGAEGDIGFWLKNQKPGVARDYAHLGTVDRTIESDAFPAALSRVNNIQDEELRDATRQRVGREWLQHDEAQAIEKLPVEVLRQIQNQ